MREPICLKELLAIVVKRGTLIICFALIAAILLGGFQFVKLSRIAKLPENSPEVLEKTYQAAMTAYEQELAHLNKTLDRAKAKLASQDAYNNDSILMNLDPHNSAVSTTVFSVSGLDALLLEEAYAEKDFSISYFTSAVQNRYLQYLNVMSLVDVLSGTDYAEVPERYLRELISQSSAEGGIITVSIYGCTEEIAAQLGKAIRDHLLQLQPQVESSSFPHRLDVVGSTVISCTIPNLESKQIAAKELADEYWLDTDVLQKQIDGLAKPTKGAPYSSATILKSTVKWAVLGGIVGVILACAWILVLFLFRSRVESSRQMEQILGVPFLGSVAKKGNLWNRLAQKMLCERVWTDAGQASAFIAQSLKAGMDCADQVAVVTTLHTKDADDALAAVSSAAATVCGKVLLAKNAEKNPETIALFQSCKQVVLAERVGVSEVPEMLVVLETAKRMGVQIVGFVTV